MTSDLNRSLLIRLCLSAQRALWGQVPPTLRAASIAAYEHCVYFRCYFDVTATEDDKELLSEAAAEILADFSDPWNISTAHIPSLCLTLRT